MLGKVLILKFKCWACKLLFSFIKYYNKINIYYRIIFLQCTADLTASWKKFAEKLVPVIQQYPKGSNCEKLGELVIRRLRDILGNNFPEDREIREREQMVKTNLYEFHLYKI